MRTKILPALCEKSLTQFYIFAFHLRNIFWSHLSQKLWFIPFYGIAKASCKYKETHKNVWFGQKLQNPFVCFNFRIFSSPASNNNSSSWGSSIFSCLLWFKKCLDKISQECRSILRRVKIEKRKNFWKKFRAKYLTEFFLVEISLYCIVVHYGIEKLHR